MMDVVLLRAFEAKCLLLSGMSALFLSNFESNAEWHMTEHVFGHLRLAVFVKRFHWYRRRL